jgi:hypothetical protein
MELLGRPFGEPTLIAIAYSLEQSTRQRRAPLSTPPLGTKGNAGVPMSADTGSGSAIFTVAATGAQSVPPSDVTFTATARFNYNPQTRQLGYDVSLPAALLPEIAGVYLHRRANRPNGGVAHILAKSPALSNSGRVTLSEQEANDLKAGKLYLAVVSRKSPRLSARADLIM